MHDIPLLPDELVVTDFGPRRIPSPLELPPASVEATGSFVAPGTGIRVSVEVGPEGPGDEPPLFFEKAGPRELLFFGAKEVRAAIVTCGGLCPGTNNVIRSVFYELYHRYGVKDVLGIRYGFQGLNPAVGEPPVPLTSDFVRRIHRFGGTVLGSSRGAQDTEVMADYLEQLEVDMLFCIGGDGTQRGAHALAEALAKRSRPCAVVGIPKTIDNDIPFVWRSFGFFTALDQAREVIQGAHVEANGARNGVGLVKVMGRDAGFIAAGATLASQEVNYCLVPEVPFELKGPGGFLEVLEKRLVSRQHAVVVVAEGAGQHLFEDESVDRHDASGNRQHRNIGLFLRQRIREHFAERGIPMVLKYFDPSYTIRSVPANTDDALLCDGLARNAVHAAMAGKTDVLIGFWHGVFVHVPIPAVVRREKTMEPDGGLWMGVLENTGQPARMGP
ncbi:MAG: ATP-dependent 6-phosphofructokinase [Acidobacteriota bacterium]